MERFKIWWNEAVEIMTKQGTNPASDEGNLFAYAYCIEKAKNRMEEIREFVEAPEFKEALIIRDFSKDEGSKTLFIEKNEDVVAFDKLVSECVNGARFQLVLKIKREQ